MEDESSLVFFSFQPPCCIPSFLIHLLSLPFPPPLLQDLSQFEALCQRLYDPAGGLSREAEKTLMQFAELPNVLQQCQFIMEQTQVGGAGEGQAGLGCQNITVMHVRWPLSSC